MTGSEEDDKDRAEDQAVIVEKARVLRDFWRGTETNFRRSGGSPR